MRGRPRKYKTPEESEFMKKKLLQEKNSKNRLTVLQFYSAQIPFCKCCGEKEMKFLSMDHVNGGGNKHRKELGFKGGKGGNISFWIIKNNFRLCLCT